MTTYIDYISIQNVWLRAMVMRKLNDEENEENKSMLIIVKVHIYSKDVQSS